MALTTDRQITSLKTTEGKAREVVAVTSPAGGGLSIEVRAGGGKTWLYRYRVNGTARKQTLGTYPAMKLAEVRQEHAKAVAQLQAGDDPARVAKVERMKCQTMPTFGELFEQWMAWKIKIANLSATTITAYRQSYRLYLDGIIGSVPVDKLTRPVLFSALSKARGVSIQGARKCLTICGQSLDLAVNHGLIELNAARTISPKDIGAKENAPRQRWLDRGELVTFWRGLDADGINKVHANALRLIMLTGARRGEAAKARWEHITGDKWVIPSENAKNGRSHTVTLSPLALEILDQQRALGGGSPWVFEAARSSLVRIDEAQLWGCVEKIRELHMPQSEPFTPHDLRRTFATGCAEFLDANERTIELALNHKSTNRLVETYQAGRRAEQVAALFLRWGELVATLTQPEQAKPNNVVAVDFGGRG